MDSPGINAERKYPTPDTEIEYLLVPFIASSAVSSPIPEKIPADLPTNALWLNSAGVQI